LYLAVAAVAVALAAAAVPVVLEILLYKWLPVSKLQLLLARVVQVALELLRRLLEPMVEIVLLDYFQI
jgi:hypothetical protein